MPEELTSKQEATSRTSAGVLRSTYIFKWVPAFKPSLVMRRARTAGGNAFLRLLLVLYQPALCWLWHPDRWYRRAGLGAALVTEDWHCPFPLSFLWTLVLQSHDFILKGYFSFGKTLCFYTCLCYFPCPTDPFAAVPWYPVRSHRSLHGQRGRAGSPKDQSSHQQRARRAVGFGVPGKMRNRFGGLPVYNQLFPLCLFPCVSRLSLCDSSRINSQWTTRGQ